MRPVRSPLRFRCPRTHAAGDYAALAQVDGGVGGATVHVDANAGGLSLEVSPQCSPCEARADVPLLVKSSRGDAIVHVKVVRSPHVYVGYVPNGIPWATTTWVDQTVRTGGDGTATVAIPHPNDELGSTYGVRVDSGGATADTRFVVPTSRAAIRIALDREEQTLGTPVGFDVYANDVGSGKPLSGATVTAQLVHGNAVSEQKLTLDGDGHARGSFSSPPLGTNLDLRTRGQRRRGDGRGTSTNRNAGRCGGCGERKCQRADRSRQTDLRKRRHGVGPGRRSRDRPATR